MMEPFWRVPCVVLDPMCGSGTTGHAALNLGRSVILNDLNPDYANLARERMEAWPDDLSGPKKDSGEERKSLLLFEMMEAGNESYNG